jgi:hypothetical protein
MSIFCANILRKTRCRLSQFLLKQFGPILFSSGLLIVTAHSGYASSQDRWIGSSPDCWEAPRNYHMHGSASRWKDYVVTARVVRTDERTLETLSPNKGYSFSLTGTRPDYEVLIDAEKEHLVALKFSDTFGLHEIKWVNENLVFLRVWWGRLRGTDLIFNAESEAFVYDQTVEDGTQAYMQFQGHCRKHGCACIEKDSLLDRGKQ